MMTTEEWNDKPCGGAGPDTSPEAVERLAARMDVYRIEINGTEHNPGAALRALSAALEAERAENARLRQAIAEASAPDFLWLTEDNNG